MNIRILERLKQVVALTIVLCGVLGVNAADINSLTTGRNAGGAYEIQLGGIQLGRANSYSLNNPARIVVDIPNATSSLARRITTINHSLINDIAVIEGEDRVRAVINLNRPIPYEVISKPHKISIVLKNKVNIAVTSKKKATAASRKMTVARVDFQRGSEGQGKVLIRLPNDKTQVDIQRVGRKVIAKLQGGRFDRAKQLNVTDFGTPVKTVDVLRRQLRIDTVNDHFEIVSYQNDKVFAIEFFRPTEELGNQALLPPGDSNKNYTGEMLSLNFQDIEVRAVLQLIGDFTNSNIVVSDEVSGSITLRLNNVPWDQALDIILQTKGLSMQKNGSVIFVAPSATIAANKKAAYNVSTVEQELAPIQQQLIQIQYARAEHIEKIIEDDRKIGNQVTGGSLLSERGSITVDPRTNTIIINDVPSNIDKVRQLIGQLDVAVSQVLIDARIVVASNDFTHELGVQWNGAKTAPAPASGRTLNSRLGVNLGASLPSTTLALQLLGADFLLDLELSALQSDGRGEVISSPRIITQDGYPAKIQQQIKTETQGTNTQGGGATPNFSSTPTKLVLDVTPKIAPDNMIDMILTVEKNTSLIETPTHTRSNENSVSTKVLVGNGETVVLGGIYEQQKNNTVSKVPLLGDIPIIGRAFRRDTNSIRKNELLIFVTPRIVDKRYISRDKFSTLKN